MSHYHHNPILDSLYYLPKFTFSFFMCPRDILFLSVFAFRKFLIENFEKPIQIDILLRIFDLAVAEPWKFHWYGWLGLCKIWLPHERVNWLFAMSVEICFGFYSWVLHKVCISQAYFWENICDPTDKEQWEPGSQPNEV